MRITIEKVDRVPGKFDFSRPTWVMTDGWITAACNSWRDAMWKAETHLRSRGNI